MKIKITLLKKSFCKLIYDTYYNSEDSRGYIVFTPINLEKKDFYPNPLSSLNSLFSNVLYRMKPVCK